MTWFFSHLTLNWRLITCPTCNIISNGFCFAFLGSYIFISDQKVKAKSNRNRNCIFSSPWESQRSHIGSFLLYSTYPPYFPLQTDTYINELVEIFLKLPTKTVWVHLIISTTLVVKQCFFHSCNKSDHLQLRPEVAIILQFLRYLGNVTSWNIRLYKESQCPVPHLTQTLQS